jgi:hypothetical protein
MTPDAFRKLALSLPESVEGAHMGHADFRAGGKIFATLGHPSTDYATIMLLPEEQRLFIDEAPSAFAPVKGGWGAKGATNVLLKAAKVPAVKSALLAAWRRRAPKSLVTEQNLSPTTKAKKQASVNWATACKIVRGLPGTEEASAHGRSGFKVGKKFLCAFNEEENAIGIRISMDERELLMEQAPEIYFLTDHYRPYPAVLIALAHVSEKELRAVLERRWRSTAPAKLVRVYDEGEPVAASKSARSRGARR